MLIRHYKQKLKMIPRDSTLSSEQKVFLIRKLRTDIIPRLEKGELVTYETQW
jgi:DNA primase